MVVVGASVRSAGAGEGGEAVGITEWCVELAGRLKDSFWVGEFTWIYTVYAGNRRSLILPATYYGASLLWSF